MTTRKSSAAPLLRWDSYDLDICAELTQTRADGYAVAATAADAAIKAAFSTLRTIHAGDLVCRAAGERVLERLIAEATLPLPPPPPLILMNLPSTLPQPPPPHPFCAPQLVAQRLQASFPLQPLRPTPTATLPRHPPSTAPAPATPATPAPATGAPPASAASASVSTLSGTLPRAPARRAGTSVTDSLAQTVVAAGRGAGAVNAVVAAPRFAPPPPPAPALSWRTPCDSSGRPLAVPTTAPAPARAPARTAAPAPTVALTIGPAPPPAPPDPAPLRPLQAPPRTRDPADVALGAAACAAVNVECAPGVTPGSTQPVVTGIAAMRQANAPFERFDGVDGQRIGTEGTLRRSQFNMPTKYAF